MPVTRRLGFGGLTFFTPSSDMSSVSTSSADTASTTISAKKSRSPLTCMERHELDPVWLTNDVQCLGNWRARAQAQGVPRTSLELSEVPAHFCSSERSSAGSLPPMLTAASRTCCTASAPADRNARMIACPHAHKQCKGQHRSMSI